MSVSVDQWMMEIKNFNNRIAFNLLFCTFHLNNFYKFFPVLCFLFVVIVFVLHRKCLINLLKFSPKHQLRKRRFEFHHKLLSCLYLAISSNYITWFITIILLSCDIEISPGPKASSRECFSIYHWNLNSTSAQSYTKVSLLTAYNLIQNFYIICVLETFLNPETSPNDPNLEISGYNMYRADHPSNCKRGGVCIFCKAMIPLRVLNISILNEWINFEVSIANKICRFIHLYRSPSQTQDEFQIFRSNLELNLDSLSSCNPFLTIMIDV